VGDFFRSTDAVNRVTSERRRQIRDQIVTDRAVDVQTGTRRAEQKDEPITQNEWLTAQSEVLDRHEEEVKFRQAMSGLLHSSQMHPSDWSFENMKCLVRVILEQNGGENDPTAVNLEDCPIEIEQSTDA